MIAAIVTMATSFGGRLAAQEQLALSQAVDAAVAANHDVVIARAAVQQAEQRISEVRAGLLPRVDFSYAWNRGNQPVFVFGSLLAQRQFAELDFALSHLNTPRPLTNIRSAFSLEQVLFDGGRMHAEWRAASAGAEIAGQNERAARSDVALAVTRAYGAVLNAAAERLAADSAMAAADEDARTAEARRDAGAGTEADVLSMRVHAADMRARAIDAASAERIARADLNRLMGAPLEREFLLVEPALVAEAVDFQSVEQALLRRPEVEQARLQATIAGTIRQSARSAMLPQVTAQGVYEWNDGRRGSPASAWTLGASVRFNLFSGGARLASLRAATHGVIRAQAERDRIEAAVRLEVLTATEQLAAARARAEVGRAMVLQARESHRMIRDRHEAGMALASEVIRAATALLDAETRRISALVDVMVGEAALRRAVGGREGQP
jgi:outer membrane protein TolC